MTVLRNQGISSAVINSAVDVSSTSLYVDSLTTSSGYLQVNYTVNCYVYGGNITHLADLLQQNVSQQLNSSVSSGQFSYLLSNSSSTSLQGMSSSIVPEVPSGLVEYVPASNSSGGNQGVSIVFIAAIAGGGLAGNLKYPSIRTVIFYLSPIPEHHYISRNRL